MSKKIFYIAVLTLLFDQVSKVIIDINFTYEQAFPIIKGFFYITNYHNTGAAWGLLNNQMMIIIGATIVLGIAIYRFMYSFQLNKRNTLAFGLLIGGLAGNLLDRLFLGWVRDFLDFRISNYYYPVFNLADASVVIAVILLIIAIIKGEDKNDNSRSKKSKCSPR